jgi:hypothetical protein
MWDPLKQGAFRASQKEFGQQPVKILNAYDDICAWLFRGSSDIKVHPIDAYFL